jgi:hypothetical protein
MWSICEIFTFPLTQILNRGQNLPSFPTFTPLYHQKKKSAVNIRKYYATPPEPHSRRRHGAGTTRVHKSRGDLTEITSMRGPIS